MRNEATSDQTSASLKSYATPEIERLGSVTSLTATCDLVPEDKGKGKNDGSGPLCENFFLDNDISDERRYGSI